MAENALVDRAKQNRHRESETRHSKQRNDTSENYPKSQLLANATRPSTPKTPDLCMHAEAQSVLSHNQRNPSNAGEPVSSSSFLFHAC